MNNIPSFTYARYYINQKNIKKNAGVVKVLSPTLEKGEEGGFF